MRHRGSVVSLDIVDAQSPTDYFSLDASWRHSKSFTLAYHSDMSLRTFGFMTTSDAGAVSASLGGMLDSVGAAVKLVSQRRPPAGDALAPSRNEIDLPLPRSSTDYEALSATQAQTSLSTSAAARLPARTAPSM